MKRRTFLTSLLFLPALSTLAQPIMPPDAIVIPFHCDYGETAMILFTMTAPCTFVFQWGYIDMGIYLRDTFIQPIPGPGIMTTWFFNDGRMQLQDFIYPATAPANYEFGTCVI